MTCWIVIPIKAPADCKTRLAAALDDAGRLALVKRMLHGTFRAASATGAELFLLGPSRHGLPENVSLLPDAGHGLNAALASAKCAAMAAAVDRLILLSADLPMVTADDVAALVNVPPATIAVAADRAGQGTNALSLPLPLAAEFRFGYGEGSFAAHREEAARLQLAFLPLLRSGLQFDLDEAEDLTANFLAAQTVSYKEDYSDLFLRKPA